MDNINIVISTFGLSSILFHEHIEECSSNTILLCDSRYQEQVNEHRSNYKMVRFFDNFDSNAMVDRFIFKLAEAFNIERLISIFEPDLLRASSIRESLMIEGDRLEQIVPFRDKIIMKDVSRNADCLTPKYKSITQPSDYLSFLRDNGYPVFVKPISSCGSVGASSIANEDDSIRFLKHISSSQRFDGFDERYQVEEYIDGKFHHVDGLVYNGDILAKRIGKYSSNADLKTIGENGFWSTVTLDKSNKNYGLINNFIKKLTSELSKYKEIFFFHCEVFIKGDDVYLCEIACRAPGGGMAKAWEHAYGVCPFRLCLEIELNGRISENSLNTIKSNLESAPCVSSVCILPIEGIYRSSPSHCPFDSVVYYKTMLNSGTKYEGCEYSGDTDCILVMVGPNQEALEKDISDSLAWYRRSSIWE